ncbi:protein STRICTOSIDINE SYNTHASE-LIKE 10-like [Argentina anserina]|uniref:protein STRICTOSIDINE SYNTHASE-LIKE 10-like n=1 Tax=Argentina anserina TaxID=57926 RepID=UPI00217680AB|nr:protein STRICTOSIDINE SYNTHASE-LIKE 10-like [Potentilla anserina]
MTVRSSFMIFSFFLFTIASPISQVEALSLDGFEHHVIPIPVVVPESAAFDCSAAAYVGIADGRMFKWLGSQYGSGEFATTSPSRPRGLCDQDNDPTCGRPLGLRFDHTTCELYMRDFFNLFPVDKLRRDFSFANSVAVSLDGNFVLVTQTTSKNIMRYWLRGPRTGQSEIFAATQGFPDNIIRKINGEFLLVNIR